MVDPCGGPEWEPVVGLSEGCLDPVDSGGSDCSRMGSKALPLDFLEARDPPLGDGGMGSLEVLESLEVLGGILLEEEMEDPLGGVGGLGGDWLPLEERVVGDMLIDTRLC